MSWSYRVVREAGVLTIREVYSSGLYSTDACHPLGLTLDELRGDIGRMRLAFRQPILEIRDGRLVQVSE